MAGTLTAATFDFACVPADFALRLPDGYEDRRTGPALLCAGIIGYRSLLRADPADGWPARSVRIRRQRPSRRRWRWQGAEVHVMTRGAEARELALALGAASAQGAAERPPVALDAAILFAPVGELVLPALEALDRGGTLAIAGIHLSDIPVLNYQRHLFQERQVRSVTSNTRADARHFLTSPEGTWIEGHHAPLSAGARRSGAHRPGGGSHRGGGGSIALIEWDRRQKGRPQDSCQTSAAASAPMPLSDQCRAIGAIRLPLRQQTT